MYPVTDGGRARLATLGVVAVLVVGPLAGAAAVLGGKLALIGVVGLAGLVVGAYIGLRHPMWLFYGLGITVGFLPFGVVPLAPLPLYLVFGGSVVLAAALHPSAGMHWHPLEDARSWCSWRSRPSPWSSPRCRSPTTSTT